MHRSLLALVFCLSCTAASAATNLTGLWWNPTESGWGITLDHQPKFLFATFFVYGADGRPTWVVGQLDGNILDTIFTGKLFTTSGSPFDKPFVAGDTRVSEVGDATLTVVDGGHATLRYTLNGATVQKAIERQTNKPININGTYEGKSVGAGGPFGTDSTDLSFSTTNGVMLIERAAFFGGTCRFSGTPTQLGSRFAISGMYQCSDFSEGTWSTDDLALVDSRYLIASIARTPKNSTAFAREFWFALKLN